MEVKIGELSSEVTVIEGVGPLTAADVKKLVKQVLELVKEDGAREAQRDRDTKITDRAFQRGRMR